MSFDRRQILGGVAATVGMMGDPVARADEQDRRLEIREQGLRLTPGGPDRTVLRYRPSDPLPVLRVVQGQTVTLRVRNALAEPTSFQLCGLRGQGSLDDAGLAAGHAIAAGAEATLRFVATDAGTAWFRPRLGSSDQAGRGASGVLIVDPIDPADVDRDMPCLLEDWPGDAMAAPTTDADAASVPIVTAAKAPIPASFAVRPGSRLRLRLVNGSVRRVMVVAIEGARMTLVAVDGQPSEPFEPGRGTLPIAPGARYDVVLDLPRDPDRAVRLILRGQPKAESAMDADRVVWELKTAGPPSDPRPPLKALVNPALPARIPLERAKRAELTLAFDGAWSVNGITGRDWPAQPVLRARSGEPVALGFVNTSRALVALNLYGQAMRLLHPLDDGWEPYWRDTVLLAPGSRNHVAFLAGPPGRWPIESGFAAQAAAGLRCWFEVASK